MKITDSDVDRLTKVIEMADGGQGLSPRPLAEAILGTGEVVIR